MKSKWTVLNKKGDEDMIRDTFGVSRIAARLLINRDICEKEAVRRFLFPDIKDLNDPMLLKGMKQACAITADALKAGERVRVVGDYDVDGIMSTYILTDGLKKLGAAVDEYIPNRVSDGYGINENIVEKAHEDGIGLIITCDNGISAVDAVKRAKSLGMTIIVTDHHEEGEEHVPADAVVDPKQEGCAYPCREICGAVVAAKFVTALASYMNSPIRNDEYLEYMCMATVCDVVALRDENRVIAKLGLEAVKNTKNLGLKALMEASGANPETLSDYHIGFILGPCLNATGRLEDASKGLMLLRAKTKSEADALALECTGLNNTRKTMSADGERLALEEAKRLPADTRVLILNIPDAQESILGIIAGRLKERFYRPVIVMTSSGGVLKGSGRSIPEYDLHEALCECSDLLLKYGGHKQAAGMTVEPGNFDAFVKKMNENCRLTQDDLCPKLKLDAVVSFELFDEDAVAEIAGFGPFGTGNPKPVFAQKGLKIRSIRYMGKDNSFLRLRLQTPAGSFVNAVSFSSADDTVDTLKRMFGEQAVMSALSGDGDLTVDMAFEATLNEFRGVREIQMRVVGIFER